MTTRRFLYGFAVAALSAAALSLALGRALPHSHDNVSASQHVPSCRVCRLQEGFVAVSSSQPIVQPIPPSLIIALVCAHAQPVSAQCPSSVLPRSPPQLA